MGGHDFAHWAEIIGQVGFPVVALLFCGYFIFYIWKWVTKTIDPAVQEMKVTIIRLTDQLRLLDQDMIRLKEKVDTVVRLKDQEKRNEKDNSN